jgi:hypothetical protein
VGLNVAGGAAVGLTPRPNSTSRRLVRHPAHWLRHRVRRWLPLP